MRGSQCAGVPFLAFHFPSFSEGLSLRESGTLGAILPVGRGFPFLFGGTFIEGHVQHRVPTPGTGFPFLFGGTFIEAPRMRVSRLTA